AGTSYSQTTATLGTAWNFGSPDAAANYYRTELGYDDRGRLDRIGSPTGTITRTVRDGLSRPISTWIGTNDTPASGEWSPDNNTTPSNMLKVSDNEYDGGPNGIGDSNLTKLTQHPNPSDSTLDRATGYAYDWR